ncbi:MAG: DNA polymerase III subunit gamma/tau [Anaerolineae bacterium]|jgi:DNA polymerase-3 subunit gamma/tau|nr:DNA polymerase III subunit gamma/tau [Anaerolineae bacterium]
MAQQALYRKWRPQTFEDLIGQEHVVRTLRNALRLGHLHHAYLLAGPRGTGKTTTARLLAKAVNCLAPMEERPCDKCEICQAVSAGRLMDLIEIDAASNTGVDDVRDLLERINFQPAQARYKVYVIDEVHMLSNSAFNALLKTLEEPPPHVIFVLATTEVHKIPATVLSRCQRFEFRRIPVELLVGRLRDIAAAEDIEIEPEALALIARTATGSVRDAISLLDQMASGGTVTAEQVRLILGAERREVIHALIRAWFAGQSSTALEVLNRAVDGGADPRQLARQLADTMRGLLLMRMGAEELWVELTAEERREFQNLAQQADPGRLAAAARLFSEVASERGAGWQPQLPLELAFVESAVGAMPVAPVQSPNPGSAPAARNIAPAPAPVPIAPSQGPQPSVPPARPPEVAQPGSVTPAPAQAADMDSLVGDVVSRWPDIKSQMRAVDLSLSALLNDARPLGQDGDGQLVLGFKHNFHRGKVNTPENRATLESLISKLLGSPLRIRCELEKDWSGSTSSSVPLAAPTTPASSPSTPPASPAPRLSQAPEDLLDGDPLIRRARVELGADPKIVE